MAETRKQKLQEQLAAYQQQLVALDQFCETIEDEQEREAVHEKSCRVLEQRIVRLQSAIDKLN